MPKSSIRKARTFNSYVGKLVRKAQQDTETELSINGAATRFTASAIEFLIGELLQATRQVSQYAGGQALDAPAIEGLRAASTLNLKAVKAGAQLAIPGLLRDEAIEAGLRAVEAYRASEPVA